MSRRDERARYSVSAVRRSVEVAFGGHRGWALAESGGWRGFGKGHAVLLALEELERQEADGWGEQETKGQEIQRQLKELAHGKVPR